MGFAKIFTALVVGASLFTWAGAQANAPVQMRFVMAHKPDNPDNVALIQAFADRVGERTGGAIHIKPVMPHEIFREDEAGVVGETDDFAASKLYAGEVEMGQMSIKAFTDYGNAIGVLDTPLIFTGHEHAAKVLDGGVGQKLRETVLAGSNGRLHGLAFTYSGGFRNFYSNKDIKSLSELKGLKMRIPGGVMSRDLTDRLGIAMRYQPPHNREWEAAFAEGAIEVDEAETIRLERYKRQYPTLFSHVKTVIETNHNLFLTMVTINGGVFDRLKPEQQRIIQEEAQALALKERELSIRQETEAKAAFQAMGIRYISLSKNDLALLREASLKVQAMHRGTLGGWMQAIRAEDAKHYANKKPEKITLNAAE
jgi:TRAP-type C4-dicarboxylate transport system substrate-binding protein